MSVDGQTMINPNALALKTVLAVDDTPENLAVVNALLRGLYKVKVSSSGEHALAIAANTSPDLILLDIMMPGLDGYEVCRRLKADPETADIPVIFLTAKSDEEGEQRGFDLGAVDYITKPISPPLLLARVKAQLSLKEARDALQRNHMEDKQRFRAGHGTTNGDQHAEVDLCVHDHSRVPYAADHYHVVTGTVAPLWRPHVAPGPGRDL
jgi:CheY-like chemotaxis protein